MKDHKPLVTIGMPVYNGELYIAEAIDSILNQSYQQLELVISDNASTDGTEQICRSYAQKDPRVRYYRFDRNYGAAKNYNHTFELAKGKYFKWAAHDDLIAPEYIEKCVNVLEKYERVGLCQTCKVIINQHGERRRGSNYFNTERGNLYKNYVSFLRYFRFIQDDADIVFGVFRSGVLSKTELIGNYHSADFVLTAHMILMSEIHIIEEELFYRRIHSNISTCQNVSNAEIEKWYDTSKQEHDLFPTFLWFNKFSEFILRSEMSSIQKAASILKTMNWLMFRILLAIKRRVKRIGFYPRTRLMARFNLFIF